MKNSRRKLPKLRGKAAERAARQALTAAREDRLTSTHKRNVLRSDTCDIMQEFENLLTEGSVHVRREVAEIVMKHCNPQAVVQAILNEDDRSNVFAMLDIIKDSGYDDIDELEGMINQSDDVLCEHLIKIFVAVGRADLVFPLAIGDKSDETVARVRRLLNEQGYL